MSEYMEVCTVYVYRFCSDQPQGLYKTFVSKEPGPLEGKVEISVSLTLRQPFPRSFPDGSP